MEIIIAVSKSEKAKLFGNPTVKDCKKILVVSGYKPTVRTFTLVLQMRGYLTDTAYTGKELKDKIKTNHYAAMLIDEDLPDMNGIDLLPKLADHKMIKILISDNPAKALCNGADGCFVKPVDPSEILALFLSLI